MDRDHLTDSPPRLPQLLPLKSMESDNEYESSSSDEIQPELPAKNPISEAIFNRYKMKKQPSIIRQQEEEAAQDLSDFQVTFRIKNLDTGQEVQIENEQQQMIISRRLSIGRDDITTSSETSWRDFWTNVYQNNQRLKLYCEQGMYDQAKIMLEYGENGYPVEIDWEGLDDWTPLHYACYEGHDDVVALLCKHKAKVDAVTRYNRNGLHIASLRGHFSVVKRLIGCGISINAYDSDGNSALHFAAENGHRDIIVYLLENGCKVTKNREGVTPIQDCCYEYLKKVFYEYGLTEEEEYEQKGHHNSNANRIHRQLLSSQDLTPESFDYHRLLGRGSFGDVFLVRKHNDDKLFAMKVLRKDKLANNNLKRYAMTERNVMSALNHPFMVRLAYAFQSPTRLFLVMDYYPGGDLGKAIARRKSFTQQETRKYICQLVLALEALHKNMIIFRDLKPDNVVLDAQGHCRLADFGLSKEGIYNNITESFCGSIAYLAPQVLSKQGHSRTVDWYLLGVVMYELIVGLPPYYNAKKEILYENIKRGPLKLPKSLSFQAKDLIKKLLCRDPKKRLGAIKDSQQIKDHPFFKDVDWQVVFARKVEMPPIQQIPKININETIKFNFNQLSQSGPNKLEGWTFIQKTN